MSVLYSSKKLYVCFMYLYHLNGQYRLSRLDIKCRWHMAYDDITSVICIVLRPHKSRELLDKGWSSKMFPLSRSASKQAAIRKPKLFMKTLPVEVVFTPNFSSPLWMDSLPFPSRVRSLWHHTSPRFVERIPGSAKSLLERLLSAWPRPFFCQLSVESSVKNLSLQPLAALSDLTHC